jgi:hypothetical protein
MFLGYTVLQLSCLHLQGERANLIYHMESWCGLLPLHGENPAQLSHTRSHALNTKANYWTYACSHLRVLTRNKWNVAMSHQPRVSTYAMKPRKINQLILPKINKITYWSQPGYGTAQTCVFLRNGAKCLKGYTARILLQTWHEPSSCLTL